MGLAALGVCAVGGGLGPGIAGREGEVGGLPGRPGFTAAGTLAGCSVVSRCAATLWYDVGTDSSPVVALTFLVGAALTAGPAVDVTLALAFGCKFCLNLWSRYLLPGRLLLPYLRRGRRLLSGICALELEAVVVVVGAVCVVVAVVVVVVGIVTALDPNDLAVDAPADEVGTVAGVVPM